MTSFLVNGSGKEEWRFQTDDKTFLNTVHMQKEASCTVKCPLPDFLLKQ